VTGRLDVGGTADAPRPSGTVTLAGAQVRGIRLGSGTLELVPGGDAIHLRGNFFDRFVIDGNLTLGKRPALAASVLFRGLPLERLFPELGQLGEVRGVASGRVDVSIGGSGAVCVAARLSELRLSAHVTQDDGTVRRVELSNEDEVRVVYDGSRIRFDHLHMQSDKGELLVTGYLDPRASDLLVRGRLDLELVEFFAHRYFDHMHGQTVANLHVGGPLARPVMNGTLKMENAVLDPVDFDHNILIPSGLLTFSNDGVQLENLRFGVGRAEAVARGRLVLRDWDPQEVHVDVSGNINAKLLELISGKLVYEVTGAAAVQLTLDGPARDPQLAGSMSV